MTAVHLLAEPLDVDAGRIVIAGEVAHHAVRVLRLREGEAVTVTDGRGTLVEGVAHPDRDSLAVEVRARTTVARTQPALHVFVAVPKSGKLDLVVQKLTELGVAAIIPWFAARTVAVWDEAKRRAHGDRARAIARSALMQSRGAWLPEVADPSALLGLPAASFVLHESSTVGLLDALPSETPDKIGLVIGPEGGLEDAEVEAMRAQGAIPVGLGRQILRAETAAIVAPALVMGHFRVLG